MRRILVLVCLLVIVPAPMLVACLWDSETLAQEREKFPGTLELITGRFLRHSTAYYQWRLDDRLKKLQADPENDSLLDDVAVSYEKLGRFDDAIEVARGQLQRDPERYESLANLGTFLIHAGRYEEGLEFIDRALQVNPDAHFGREKYQRLLVRYILEKFPSGEITLPLAKPGDETFVQFLAAELSNGQREGLDKTELSDAIKGVSGMMRFSKHDHPLLLDVLGQLLLSQYNPQIDAKRLAARCFFMAASVATDATTTKSYRNLASDALSMQVPQPGSSTPVKPQDIEQRFDEERKDAETWFADLANREQAWIEAGADVESKFNEYYRSEPAAPESVEDTAGLYSGETGPRLNRNLINLSAVVCLAIAGALYLTRKWLLRRRDRRHTTA